MRSLIIIFILFLVKVVEGSCSARGSSLGDALYADYSDISGILFNPAALAWVKLKRGESLFSYTGVNRDLISFQRSITLAIRLNKDLNLATFYTLDNLPIHQIKDGEYIIGRQNSYNLLLGLPGRANSHKFAGGIGLNYKDIAFKLRHIILGVGAIDEDLAKRGGIIEINIGFLYKFNKGVTFGIVAEDLSEAELDLGEKIIGTLSYPLKIKNKRKLNLGVSLKLKDGGFLYAGVYSFSLRNIYDIEGLPQSSMRLGIEYSILPKFILRAGVYGKNFHAIGIGIPKISLDKLIPSKSELTLNYAWIDWGTFSNHIIDIKLNF